MYIYILYKFKKLLCTLYRSNVMQENLRLLCEQLSFKELTEIFHEEFFSFFLCFKTRCFKSFREGEAVDFQGTRCRELFIYY